MDEIVNRFLPVITVKNDIITDCNDVLTDLLSVTSSDILGTQVQNILSITTEHNDDNASIKQLLSHASESEIGVFAFATIKNKHNYELPAKVHCQCYEKDGENFKFCFQMLENKSTDHVTGLPNGWALHSRAEHLLRTPCSAIKNFVVIVLSVDNFSTINFRYGFNIGDDFLSVLGKKLRATAKEYGLVVRFSNAKFGILVTNQYEFSAAAFTAHIIQLCQNICHLADSPLRLSNGLNISKSFSIGVSEESTFYESCHAMEIAAETAMLEAKKYSISKYCVATSQTTDDLLSRKLIIDDLAHAIEQSQINIHYQPQYDLRNGELIGFEALARWQHNVLGNIPPDVFVGIAEDIALHFEFDLWVFTQVCSQIVEWQRQGIDPPRIAINVSFKTLEMTIFIARLTEVLKKTKCPRSLVELEITETTSAKNIKTLHDNIIQIKKLGINISVDDFGSGYSSLSLIRTFHLSLDKLKIDRSLIENICNTAVDREFTRKIIELSRVLNVKILAEGVENLDQYNLLKKLGCDYAQGYYFDKALLKQEAEQLIYTKMHNKTHTI